jgi:hypothetical protein
MNKQMTPAEIELVQQSFARPDPISDKSALVGVEPGPWPPSPNIPAAIAPADVNMK